MIYDIAIIGGGPGGYVAALRAAQLGAKTVIVEKDEVGGVCLNKGCIPTKTIISSINTLRHIKQAAEMGIELQGTVKVNLEAIRNRKNKVVSGLVKGIHYLLKGAGVEVLKGTAHINSDRTVTVGDTKIESRHLILSTGSVWKTLPGIDYDGKLVVSSDELLELENIPERLLIIGGGVIGCEFACIYNALGSKVTIIEALPNILPMEGPTTTKILERSLKKQGIDIRTATLVQGLNKGTGKVEAVLNSGDKIEADKVLLAIGRKPNLEGAGIQNLGVWVERGAVVTDEHMATNVDRVYAIGDLNGKYMLAHVASEEGVIAAENIMGNATKMLYNAIPRPVFTYPEVSGVGLTEKELQDAAINFKTGKFTFAAIPKAVADGETIGHAQIYADSKGGQILGAEIIGEHATELAHEIAIAVQNELKLEDIEQTIHSHPTLSEVIKEAALDANGRAIHKIYK